MKRKSKHLSEDENSSSKKMKTYNYNELMLKLYQLFQSISNSVILKDCNDLHTKYLNDIKNKIPIIVFFGNQSSGKSTLVKALFKSERVIRAGTGTRCPIEMRIGSIYTIHNIYIQNANGDKLYCGSILEAEQKISEINNNANYLGNCIIVQEIPDPKNSIIIVDLPGVKSEGYDEYFNRIRTQYLEKPETIIVHVMRGDTDPSTDNSLKHLNGINNHIIRVLTHTDIWIADPSKKSYFDIINNDYKSNNICVVNNVQNENEFFTRHDMQLPDIVIKGIVSLYTLLHDMMILKLKAMGPVIRTLSMSAKHALEQELSKIGYDAPNMREESIHFRQYMHEHVRKEFNDDHTQFSHFVNQIKGSISPKDILEYFKTTVNEKLLTEEQQNGSRRKIKGSEGWSSIMMKYYKQLMDQVKLNNVPQMFHKYIEIIDNTTRKLFENAYKPCTKKLQEIITVNAINHLHELEKDSIAKLQTELEMMANDPNISWDQYAHGYRVDSYTPIAKNIIHILSNSPDLIIHLNSSISECTVDAIVKQILPKAVEHLVSDDPYKLGASSAFDQLKNMWNVQSKIIHANILTHLANMDRKYEQYLYGKIQETDASDLHEDESVARTRESLTNFLTQINDILLII